MILTNVLFIYFFLPAFMAVYILLPAKKRPWIIAAANLLILFANGAKSLILFLVGFWAVYFSAIYIYNTAKKESSRKKRRIVFTLNIILSLLMLALCAPSAAVLSPTVRPFAIFGAAVIPLHMISYITDVYRGDCEAQTRITSLAAYLSFFPSVSFGPVLKYKNFEKSFRSPSPDHSKTAAGIKNYVCGLAEYVIIGGQLEKVRQSILSTSGTHIHGAAVWLSLLIFYVLFCVKISGMIHMGQGVALIMGFPVKRCFKSVFLCRSLRKKAFAFNIPFNMWLKDYIFRPLSRPSRKMRIPAFFLTLLFAALWYKPDLYFAAGALFLAAAVTIDSEILSKSERLDKKPGKELLKFIFTKAATVAAVFICAVSEVLHGGKVFPSLFHNSEGFTGENDFFRFLLTSSVLPLVIGLIIISTAIPKYIERINRGWFRAALPAIELVLLMLSTAFIISA